MSIDLNVRERQAPIEAGRAGRFRLALPPEIAATLLAVSTVALGALLGLPTYGIFLGWAAAGLAGTGRPARLPVLARCLAVGAVFGAGTLAATSALESVLGPDVPQWVCAAVVLAVANPLMIMVGRAPALSSVPGMFIGFSTLFAVFFSNTAAVSGNIVAALLVTVSMNLTGLAFYLIYNRLTGRPRAERA
ncbi:uncharacterized protein DUF1097 [Microterricola gilva]|uniref:Uncharacterized protein DUF1097 n=1 Tax=Microterricola gilva TaxID=393267 RepID=A0A4Q8AQ79_9MICO|nr:DUF1097 domain-containing protein [Microterricola gilva]RZU66860.1 uncharacterized protein DUF1097 [Microterricola gilva]